MGSFIKRPTKVEAWQYHPGVPIVGVEEVPVADGGPDVAYGKIVQGPHQLSVNIVQPGDYVVKDEKGWLTVMKEDEFIKEYVQIGGEPAETPDPAVNYPTDIPVSGAI